MLELTDTLRQRSVWLCILLSFLTLGIFDIYWIFCLNEDVNAANGQVDPLPGFVLLFLNILTLGIFNIYWIYQCGKTMEQLRADRGEPRERLAVLYAVLTLFHLGTIALAFLQLELNRYAQ